MKDLIAHWEKLRADAAECAKISNLAVDKTKRVAFAQLAAQLTMLASELERVITARADGCAN
jgi:hypothetical protein